MVLGVYGFMTCPDCSAVAAVPAPAAARSGFVPAVTHTLALIKAAGSFPLDSRHWPLFFAQIIMPALAFFGVFKLVLQNLRRDARVLWAQRLKDHIIVCGLGDTGRQIVESFRDAGKPVVVITLDGSSVNAVAWNGAMWWCWKAMPASAACCGWRACIGPRPWWWLAARTAPIWKSPSAPATCWPRPAAAPVKILPELRSEWLYDLVRTQSAATLGSEPCRIPARQSQRQCGAAAPAPALLPARRARGAAAASAVRGIRPGGGGNIWCGRRAAISPCPASACPPRCWIRAAPPASLRLRPPAAASPKSPTSISCPANSPTRILAWQDRRPRGHSRRARPWRWSSRCVPDDIALEDRHPLSQDAGQSGPVGDAGIRAHPRAAQAGRLSVRPGSPASVPEPADAVRQPGLPHHAVGAAGPVAGQSGARRPRNLAEGKQGQSVRPPRCPGTGWPNFTNRPTGRWPTIFRCGSTPAASASPRTPGPQIELTQSEIEKLAALEHWRWCVELRSMGWRHAEHARRFPQAAQPAGGLGGAAGRRPRPIIAKWRGCCRRPPPPPA